MPEAELSGHQLRMQIMRTVLALAADALSTALSSYGAVALVTVAFPNLGAAEKLWPVAPIAFGIQFVLKLFFSRDDNGRLRRLPNS
jgi:hypothetical protein